MCNNVTTAELNFCDIGIAVCSIVGGTPEFSRLLAADTVYIDEKAFFDYRAGVRWGELENGHYILRLYKRNMGKVFQTITVDNGSEFADYSEIGRSINGGKRAKVCYCHSYSSFERGSNENLNKMIRLT